MPSESTPLLPRALPVMSQILWRTGAAFTAVGMIAGAFGSHGLRSRVPAEKVRSWEVGAQYMIYNGLGLLLLSLHPRFALHRFAGPAITLGGALFSCSIFGLVLGGESFRFLGPVTPIGGSIMIAGYAALAF